MKTKSLYYCNGKNFHRHGFHFLSVFLFELNKSPSGAGAGAAVAK